MIGQLNERRTRIVVNGKPSSNTVGHVNVVSRPLRIAMCPPELHPLQQAVGGKPAEATYIIQAYISAGLQARGHSLSFVAPRSPEEIVCTNDPRRTKAAPRSWSESRWFDLASRNSWRIQRLLGVPYLNVFSNYRLFDACLQCLPGHDLVYERNGLYKFGVAMACKRLRLPYVLYFEADDVLESDYMGQSITGLLRWRAKEAIRYNLDAADCVICVSTAGKDHVIRRWHVPAEKVVVFPNVADVQRFRPFPEARPEVRSTFGIGADPLIIFVGGFYEWHDIATMLDAFSQVLLTHPNARLMLVGDGQKRPSMMQHAIELGIDHAVTFTGAVAHAEVPRLMAAADIAVAPYPIMKQAMWLSPLKVFEYMASGTPVVASAAGQIAEIIQDGYNGLLVPPGDARKLATALQELIEDVALRDRLGQQARTDAVNTHSWEHYISRLEAVFAAVIAGQPVDRI